MEIKNTVTDMFTDDIKEDLEMDLMFNVINQVGDKIDQTSGMGDTLTDNIIKGEMKRSSVKENHGLFTTMDTERSINVIKTTLKALQDNFDVLIETGVKDGNFSTLKEYVDIVGKTDKDIYYAQYTNICMENAIKEMKEVREAFISTEDKIFSKSLTPIQQHVVASRDNKGLSLLRIEEAINVLEDKLQKRIVAVEQVLSEINDDQFAYEVEETNNEEPVNPTVSKEDNEKEDPFNDMEGTMEESTLELLNLTEGYTSLDESYSMNEGTLRQLGKDIGTAIAAPNSLTKKGDYSKLRVALIKRAKDSKKVEDIDYLIKDTHNAINTLEKLAKNLRDAKKEVTPSWNQKKLLKNIENGQTPEAVDGQIKWLKDVYLSTLKAKKEELKKKA